MSLHCVAATGLRRLALTTLVNRSTLFLVHRRLANTNAGTGAGASIADANPRSNNYGRTPSTAAQLRDKRTSGASGTSGTETADADSTSVPSHQQQAPTSAELLSNRAAHAVPNTVTSTETGTTGGGASIVINGHTLPPLSSNNDVLPHPIWPQEFVDSVQPTHRQPRGVIDYLALWTIKTLRFNFDWMSGWNRTPYSTDKALSRICFLETVAGVPGSIAAMQRHLASLRRMRRDNGWINTLLAEAENERMHLLTALTLKQPTLGFRAAVFVTQGVFFNFFFLAYLVSPRYCHRLVGFLEEEAVKTYTKILERIDDGTYKSWQTGAAPTIAINYWKLPKTATMRDVINVIRADENHHREINHNFADLKPTELNIYNSAGAKNYSAGK